MNNFSLYNPVKIHFGEGQIKQLSTEIPKDAKVLITYGGGSIKANAVYQQVIDALQGHAYIEFSGIEPNPEYETCMKAVALIKKEKIDFVLAVGGGSIIDATKFIVAAVDYEGKDPWDILAKGAEVTSAIPYGTVLTLPATGSEMNAGSVISRREFGDKLAFGSPHVFPKFSILDPVTTYTLPIRQVTNGIVDAFVHVMEQYLTYPANAPIQDRFAEGILLTLIEEGPKALENPKDYDARANIMWCATMALNGLINQGVPQDWATHMIGHELTAMYGLDHAQTLAIVLPNIINYKRDKKEAKLLQYAERVWNITEGNTNERIDAAIEKTRAFFEAMGAKTKLSGYDVDTSKLPDIVSALERHNMVALGEHKDIAISDSKKILEMCI
jgi:NADP-dependent alcohol dehydrogenase